MHVDRIFCSRSALLRHIFSSKYQLSKHAHIFVMFNRPAQFKAAHPNREAPATGSVVDRQTVRNLGARARGRAPFG